MGSEKYKRCFEPLTIKGVTFKNRIFVTPNIAGWGSRGQLTNEQAAHFERMAAGGPASVTLGNLAINMKECSDEVGAIDLSNEATLLGLNVLRDKVDHYDCVLSAQINYAGRNGWYPGSVHYAPSPIPAHAELERAEKEGRTPQPCYEMSKDKIYEVIDLFANGALMLKRAGFRMMMVHCAHNNLIGQFFSPLSNFRNDEYGGTLENRARFGEQVLQAIRRKVGNDMLIDIRMSSEIKMPGGLSVEESIAISKILEPYSDIFTISNAFHNPPTYIQDQMTLSMYLPQLPLLEYTKEYRKELKDSKLTYTTCVMDLDNAEYVLEQDIADFVGMYRPLLADPDIVRKYSRDQREDVNFCIRCEWHNRHAKHLPVGCAVNPACGKYVEFPKGRVPKTPEPQKIMIIGGGPAGMQAALTAIERGHEVVLYEAADKLGGNLYKAGELPIKREIHKYIDYIVPRVMDCGAKIVLNKKATPEDVKAENPDVLLLAIGAADVVPPIPGVDGPNVHFCYEADAKECEVADKVVIIGGGLVGMECAWALAQEGKDVTVLDRDDMDTCMERMNGLGQPLYSFSTRDGAKVIYKAAVDEITQNSVIYRDENGRKVTLEAGTVLLGAGVRAKREELESFRHVIAEGDIFQLGINCVSNTIGDATNAAFDLMARL